MISYIKPAKHSGPPALFWLTRNGVVSWMIFWSRTAFLLEAHINMHSTHSCQFRCHVQLTDDALFSPRLSVSGFLCLMKRNTANMNRNVRCHLNKIKTTEMFAIRWSVFRAVKHEMTESGLHTENEHRSGMFNTDSRVCVTLDPVSFGHGYIFCCVLLSLFLIPRSLQELGRS